MSAPSEKKDRGNPLWGITIQSLHATRDRPIFSPSRRPPMPAALPAPVAKVTPVNTSPAVPDRPPFDLVGVVVGAGQGYAVFVSSTTHDLVRLRTGEGEDGWVLRSVRSREAVLEKDHKVTVVRLPSPMGDQK